MTAGLSWVGQYWEWLAGHGWGAVVFAAVGAVCIIGIALGLFLLSFALGALAWRRLRPLPASLEAPLEVIGDNKGTPKSISHLSAGDRPNAVSMAEFDRRIDRLKLELAPQDHQETIAAMRSDIVTTRAKVQELMENSNAQHTTSESLKGILAGHERAIGRIPSETTMSGIAEALLLQIAISLLDSLIQAAPPVEEREPTGDFHAKAIDYLRLVTEAGLPNQRLAIIRAGMESAKLEVENLLRLAPPPLSGSDLLNHREWAISVRQVATVVMILERMKRDAEVAFRDLRPLLMA